MGLTGASVHFLPANIRKDPLAVLRSLRDQLLHFDYWGRVRIRVVEGKPHPEDIAPDKALPGIRTKARGALVATLIEKERSDEWYGTTVEVAR